MENQREIKKGFIDACKCIHNNELEKATIICVDLGLDVYDLLDLREEIIRDIKEPTVLSLRSVAILGAHIERERFLRDLHSNAKMEKHDV